MSDYRRTEKPDNTALWVVLGLVGGGVLLVALLCGGVIYLWMSFVRTTQDTFVDLADKNSKQFWQQVDKSREQLAKVQQQQVDDQAAQAVARRFLEDCLAGRYNAAYQDTSAVFRQRWDRKQFEELLEQRLAGPNRRNRFAVPPFLTSAGNHHYRYTTNDGGAGRVEFTVNMVRVDNDWKVDEMSVDPVR